MRTDEAEATAIGIRGVPFFVIDRKYGVNGAQPAEVLLQALERAWAERSPLVASGLHLDLPGKPGRLCLAFASLPGALAQDEGVVRTAPQLLRGAESRLRGPQDGSASGQLGLIEIGGVVPADLLAHYDTSPLVSGDVRAPEGAG